MVQSYRCPIMQRWARAFAVAELGHCGCRGHKEAMNATIRICVGVLVVFIPAITIASPPPSSLPSPIRRHNNDKIAREPTANVCRHSGLPATHQRGVARVGSGSTQTSPLGPNASLWGAECAALCCLAGPTKCRFWSAEPGADGKGGVCALLPRFVPVRRKCVYAHTAAPWLMRVAPWW